MKQVTRCHWCGDDPLYVAYHDHQWGVPVRNDALLFEFLLLETFQAGLSWITVLRKRENFRQAFDQFDPNKIAQYTTNQVDQLMHDAGIIRHRKKIESAIINASLFLKVQQEYGSFSDFVWSFVDHQPLDHRVVSIDHLPSKTELSDTLSLALKKIGFKFVGSTVVYAFMQATGMVNDHLVTCFRYKELKEAATV